MVVIFFPATKDSGRSHDAIARAVDQHEAGAALAAAAAEARADQAEIVAQHVEQRRVRRRGDVRSAAVDVQTSRIAVQTRAGENGKSRWWMPSGRSASSTAFAIAGTAPTVPASPAPLTPSRLVGEGTRWSYSSTRVWSSGARHRVVHEGAGEQLAARGRTPLLAERLADALRDAAVQLALEQRVVHDAAAVVDADVAQHARPCRSPGRSRPRRRARRSETRPAAACGPACRARCRASRDLFIVTETSVPFTRNRRRRTPGRRGDTSRSFAASSVRLPDHFLGGRGERAAVLHRRARADRAAAGQRRAVRIARPQRDRFRREAEDLADDLRVAPSRAPARSSPTREASALPDSPNLITASSFGTAPAPEGSTNMAQPMPRSLPFALEAFVWIRRCPVRIFDRLLEQRREIAAVVGRAGRRLVREAPPSGSGCAGAARSGRCRSGAPLRRPGARPGRTRSAGRRRGRRWSTWCW